MAHILEGSDQPPGWFSQAAEIEDVIEAYTAEALDERAKHRRSASGDLHTKMLPLFALHHVRDSIATSLASNAAGCHAVALALTIALRRLSG